MGALFIPVVVAFPNGLAGIYRRYLDPLVDRVLPPRAAPTTTASKRAHRRDAPAE